MDFSKKHFLFMICAGILLLTVAFLMVPRKSAQAQCGSQASSCKNCHEVQGKDPVNSDGTGWHESHAFGDFCQVCHGGDNQSMDEGFAHASMSPPMSNIGAACATCHIGDLNEKAKVYADALGVTIGENSGPAATQPGPAATEGSQSTQPAPAANTSDQAGAPPGSTSLVVSSDEVVDYQQRYNQVVLGVTPINWGNVILVVMILLIVVGGGMFVYAQERKRRGQPIFGAKPAMSTAVMDELPVVEGYPQEIVALLPKIARLDPLGLHALQRLLEDPQGASELFHSLSRLDPELVKRVRTLDRATRELLLAMTGD
jgi:hypothetical protein